MASPDASSLGRSFWQQPRLMGRWRCGMLRVVAGYLFFSDSNAQFTYWKNEWKMTNLWKILCNFKNWPHECTLQQDHRMWCQSRQKTLCYCLTRLKLEGKTKKKIYLILNYTVLKYSSFMWLYSGVVSAEEHRSGLSHESLPPELCELWPWGSARGSGMLGWSCSFVELAWTEKRYGEEWLRRYVIMPYILKLIISLLFRLC